MSKFRIIPNLLIENDNLVKGVHFRNHKYVGDPLNAMSIFNEKEVDEIVIMDRSAQSKGINFPLVERIAAQAFMPLSYGGGIRNIEDVTRLLQSGVEKVILNEATIDNTDLVSATADKFGSSSTIVAIDAKSGPFSDAKVWYRNATKKTGISALEHACKVEQAGAGEVLLTSVNNEGTMKGFDLKLIHKVSHSLSIPVIASGGAGNINHINEAIKHGASAVAVGSMCVFWGKYRAVLISYPKI